MAETGHYAPVEAIDMVKLQIWERQQQEWHQHECSVKQYAWCMWHVKKAQCIYKTGYRCYSSEETIEVLSCVALHDEDGEKIVFVKGAGKCLREGHDHIKTQVIHKA